MVGETCPARSDEFEGMISVREDVDVHGAIDIVFLLLLIAPSVPPLKKTSTLGAPLHSRSSRIVAIVKELQFDFGIDLGLKESEKPDVVLQCLNQSFSSTFALRIYPSSKRSEGG